MAETADPTMEEILASIRRIIEDEQEGTEAKPAAPAPPPPAFDDEEEPLTLTDEEPSDVLELSQAAQYVPEQAPAEKLVSEAVEDMATSKLSTLSGLVVRGYPGSQNTLEGLVREMLKPMLRDWLDTHLPDLVEQMVAREIARISGRAR